MAGPADKRGGAETERSRQKFRSGGQRMPIEVSHAYGLLKQAAADANIKLKKLDTRLGKAIIQAAGEVASGQWDEHFPLVVWQTGSGTQTNMNVNEVVANRANELIGGRSEERRVGKEGVRTCRYRGSTDH